MSGYWIKMRHELTADPKVLRIAEATGLDEFAVIGRLHAVWSWLDQHSETGLGVRITAAFLDRLAACPKFAAGMRAVEWLKGRDGALEFPNYAEHNGETAKKRAIDNKRKLGSGTGKPKVSPTADAAVALPVVANIPTKLGTEENREEMRESESSALVSLEEALKLAATRPGFGAEEVRLWHAQRNAQGWVRGSGLPVKNWQSDLEVWVMRGARGEAPSKPPAVNTNPKPKPETTAAPAGKYDGAWGGEVCDEGE